MLRELMYAYMFIKLLHCLYYSLQIHILVGLQYHLLRISPYFAVFRRLSACFAVFRRLLGVFTDPTLAAAVHLAEQWSKLGGGPN